MSKYTVEVRETYWYYSVTKLRLYHKGYFHDFLELPVYQNKEAAFLRSSIWFGVM